MLPKFICPPPTGVGPTGIIIYLNHINHKVFKMCGYKIINNLGEKYATRETKISYSIIDHVISNFNREIKIEIEAMELSDHKTKYLKKKIRESVAGKLSQKCIR